MDKDHNISVKITLEHLRIYINEILHISIKLDEILGIQSWIHSKKSYKIEFYLKKSTILCVYDNFYKWKTILTGIDNLDII